MTTIVTLPILAGLAFAVVDVPHVVFLIDPDR